MPPLSCRQVPITRDGDGPMGDGGVGMGVWAMGWGWPDREMSRGGGLTCSETRFGSNPEPFVVPPWIAIVGG